MNHQTIIVLDFGGQYNQLIARRVREQNVYCDLLPYDMTVEKIREYDPVVHSLVRFQLLHEFLRVLRFQPR